tara:strand:+ start:1238 stop:1534 length:297 start_codon:yes stop_codon:yes gene_type:complete
MAGNEVIAKHAHASGVLADCRGRFKGFVIGHDSGSSGHIILYDNDSAASGTVVIEVDEKGTGNFGMEIPGDGIIFHDGLYVSLPSNTSITVFVQLGGR